MITGLFRNFLLQGKNGIVVKAAFAHCAVCQGLASRMWGEISETLDKSFLLLVHVSFNDTIKVNSEHTEDGHRVLSARNSGIVFHMGMVLLVSDNG